MQREQTIAKAASAIPDYGISGLSVWSAVDLSAADIVRLARSHGDATADPPKRFMPYGRMRTSTVGQLRACGFEMRPDSPFGHYLLTIPTPATDDAWDALQNSFGEAEPTPSKEGS
jgi:hypothetical protein